MKKPTQKPKPDPSSGKKTPGSTNDRNIGKALDVAKQALSATASVAGVFTERERTFQAETKAHADVRKAEEETSRCRIGAQKRLAELVVDDKKNQMDHERNMKVLANERENDTARIRQQDRLLDHVLDQTTVDSPVLEQSVRALLSKPGGD